MTDSSSGSGGAVSGSNINSSNNANSSSNSNNRNANSSSRNSNNGGGNGGGRGGGRNKSNQPKKSDEEIAEEAFKGAVPRLGTISKGTSLSAQRVQMNNTLENIYTYMGTSIKAVETLESLRKLKVVQPPYPAAVEIDKDDSEVTKKMKENTNNHFSKLYAQNCDQIKIELAQAFNHIWGQMSPAMKVLMLSTDNFEEDVKNKSDTIELLKRLKSNTETIKDKMSHPFYRLVCSQKEGINTIQKHKESPTDFKKRQEAAVEADTELSGANLIYNCPALVDILCKEKGKDKTALSDDEKKELMAEGAERMKAMYLLVNADRARFGHLLTKCKEDFIAGRDTFPKTADAAYAMLLNANADTKPQGNNQGGNNRGRENGSEEGATANSAGHSFHVMGTADDSVQEEDDGVSDDDVFFSVNEYESLMFFQSHNDDDREADQMSNSVSKTIPDTWLLLDSQSSVNVVSNRRMLSRIYKYRSTLTVRGIAGVTKIQHRGFLHGFGWVWFYEYGIANILSLSRVREKFWVTYDSAGENAFQVHKPDGSILNFREAGNRLFYFDMANRDETGTVLVNTVADNISKFSGRDVAQADLARKLQIRIGRPSDEDFARYVRDKVIKNCPITVQDIKTAELIYGREVGALQGKTTRRQPPAVRVDFVPLPPQVMERYRDVTLSVDIMKVMNIPFFMTISRDIKFGTSSKLNSMKTSHILKHFKTLFGIYFTRGFRPHLILADNQFESMRGDLADLRVHLTICGRDEHVPEAERFNRTIKERVRANYCTMPFTHMPPLLIIEMVYSATYWRNRFPLRGGISTTQSPSEIILGKSTDYSKQMQLGFGDYVHTHEEHSNDMEPRTIGAIATRPSNDEGAYYFLSLSTGRRINRVNWTPLPMPQEAINCVHRLARRAKASKKLTFTNVNGDDMYD